MKFIFADSLDFVDPRYDFVADRTHPDREPYWDDNFPHEILGYAPYDGILVSRAIVGGYSGAGKYTESQAMRFIRVGAREFLRFRECDYPGTLMFGDSGAFSYHTLKEPPYSTEEIVDFYGDGRFTHGCSIDHVIFDFDVDGKDDDLEKTRLEECQRRQNITLNNAEEFLRQSRRLGNSFVPMGVVQGWSPTSMAFAALSLKKMGYSYIAIGGMVPLRAPQILKVIVEIRNAIGNDIGIHLLGFAKAEEIGSFLHLNITSFDSTSPLIRAFKDSSRNYFTLKPEGGLDYYSALRIPQSLENNTLKSLAKMGVYSQEDLQNRESHALRAMRAYDVNEASADETLDAVMSYSAPLTVGRDYGHTEIEERKLRNLRDRYKRTLVDKPWRSCDCRICQQAGIDVIIFRASNRNKRRGIHNIQVYQRHLKNNLVAKKDETN